MNITLKPVDELGVALTIDIARELVLEDGPLDEERFAKVMNMIIGTDGTHNAFDAPILYKLLQLKGE